MRKKPLPLEQKFLLGLGALVVAAVFFCLPVEYVASPEWEVRVVDNRGEAIPSPEIEQTWSYYFGAISKSSFEVLKGDESGRILLPKRTFSAIRFTAWSSRALGILNVHSSFGPQASVFASAPGYERTGLWRDSNTSFIGGVLRSTIVLHLEQTASKAN